MELEFLDFLDNASQDEEYQSYRDPDNQESIDAFTEGILDC